MAYTIDDELRPQRAYSPGVVQDEEELLRFIEYPLKAGHLVVSTA